MNYERRPYDDAATPAEMRGDCTQVGRTLSLPVQRDEILPTLGEGARAARGPAVTGVQISPELAEMAADLELHVD